MVKKNQLNALHHDYHSTKFGCGTLSSLLIRTEAAMVDRHRSSEGAQAESSEGALVRSGKGAEGTGAAQALSQPEDNTGTGTHPTGADVPVGELEVVVGRVLRSRCRGLDRKANCIPSFY